MSEVIVRNDITDKMTQRAKYRRNRRNRKTRYRKERFETGQFDTHLMKNPNLASPKIKHWGYQKGINYGFENTKAMVLNRDNYIC